MAAILRAPFASKAGRVLSSCGSCYARGYNTLLVAEHDSKKLSVPTLQALSAASKLPGSSKLHVLVMGSGCDDVAAQAAKTAGVDKVLVANTPQFSNPVADSASELLVDLKKTNDYKVIAGAASSLCRETLPRVAAKLDVQPVTDIIKVCDEEGVFQRPMYAGNAIATVKTTDETHILTFRGTAFEPAAASGAGAEVETVGAQEFGSSGIEFVSNSEAASDKPQLASANKVVSGGRGLKKGENFGSVLEPLCDKLNAAMGASRAAVDAGFVPNELQVGQTGKVVAPDLYIAVGISGAIQHLAGMKDSKTIVAINKDADAPIFQVADYGLVGDLFEVVPELCKKI